MRFPELYSAIIVRWAHYQVVTSHSQAIRKPFASMFNPNELPFSWPSQVENTAVMWSLFLSPSLDHSLLVKLPITHIDTVHANNWVLNVDTFSDSPSARAIWLLLIYSLALWKAPCLAPLSALAAAVDSKVSNCALYIVECFMCGAMIAFKSAKPGRYRPLCWSWWVGVVAHWSADRKYSSALPNHLDSAVSIPFSIAFFNVFLHQTTCGSVNIYAKRSAGTADSLFLKGCTVLCIWSVTQIDSLIGFLIIFVVHD